MFYTTTTEIIIKMYDVQFEAQHLFRSPALLENVSNRTKTKTKTERHEQKMFSCPSLSVFVFVFILLLTSSNNNFILNIR